MRARLVLGSLPPAPARRRRGLRPAVLALLVCALADGGGSTSSGASDFAAKPSEYEVKAAYLYNFGKFVDWPPGALAADDVVEVCVLGLDPFGPTLDRTLAAGRIAGRPTVPRRITHLDEGADCRILFISASEDTRLGRILEGLEGKSVLTVSDMESFTQRGGMIQFVLQDERVRFEINLTAATDAGLFLSSELLRVATTVHREDGL